MLPIKTCLICVIAFGNMILAQEKKITGKVLSEGFPVKEIEVINSRNKSTVKTNTMGEFTIPANKNDELIVYSDKYQVKKIKLKEKDFVSQALVIELSKKTIELKEVEVKKATELNVDVSYDALKAVEIEKQQSRPKPLGVYTGETYNGIDFVKVGEKILVLFRGGNEKFRKKEAAIEFRDYIKNNFSDEFFVEKLHLDKSEIPLFIDFCSNDFASIKIPQSNELDVIAFLIQKRSEYKK